MFNKKTTVLTSGADAAIEIAFEQLKNYDPQTAEYSATLTQIERLAELHAPAKGEKLSKDNLISVGGNLLGIGMILGYERTHVLATKALTFVLKSKV